MKNNDNIEKVMTAIAAIVGIGAVFFSLTMNGFSLANLVSAAKDLSGLIVTLAVFLLANKIFSLSKLAKFDFNAAFEKYLKDWILQNDYLVCENFAEDGKGKHNKRYCSMVIEHSNMVTRTKLAKDAAQNKEKGAFVYLPYTDETGTIRDEFEFRFNERTFDRQTIYHTDDGAVDLKAIIEEFRKRIEDNFKSIGVQTKASPSQKTLSVSFSGIERTEANAKQLIDIVEFVKTMVLALA